MNSHIALLTDFGTKDYFVGAMKGAILSINEMTNIIDITHETPPQDIRSASFTLRACYKDFPFKTIFVAVVDPGVGSKRKAILVETENYCFVAPDNGLLSFVFDEEENFRARELTNQKFFAAEVSRTFHGRDVFARVAAHLSKGINPNEFGAEIKDFIHIKTARPRKISEQEIEASIIHIDHFGNLITNLKQTDLPENFTLKINGKIINKLQSFFAEAEQSELFMILGSAGFLEIAAFQDSAEKLLKVQINQKALLVT
ncbi:MAG: SAM-dependent chlorinase/fluorinase [Acidobacteriota bacterium]|nr:SAM-dependent chlorinase/fluorinase [Acidobacteriota bacterium]